MLAASDPGMEAVWLQDCRGSFASMIADKQRREAAEAKSQAAQSIAQPDELIDFVHLKVRDADVASHGSLWQGLHRASHSPRTVCAVLNMGRQSPEYLHQLGWT